MTIPSAQSIATLQGNGVTTTWDLSFVPDAPNYIFVTYTDQNGAETLLQPIQYTLTVNPPATGQLWSNSFSIIYPLSGSPIANGTSLTVQRILPLQQLTSLSNQGNFYPAAVEAALDTLEMQIQQVAARTGAWRGTWASGVIYNFGDLVQDGANGAYTNNIYVCVKANISTIWGNDLANGDWNIIFNANNIAPSPGVIITQQIVSSGSTYTSATSSTFIGWNSATTANKTTNIPASAGTLTQIIISDLYGTAGTYPISIVPASGSIIGTNSIYTNNSSITLLDTNNGWMSI